MAAMLFCMAVLEVFLLLYFTVSTLVSASHLALVAPAAVAAASIFLAHISQLPDTLMVSVTFCACTCGAMAMSISDASIVFRSFIVLSKLFE